jgi:hypothetical protein
MAASSKIMRIAGAMSRLNAWKSRAYDELPEGYTTDSLEFHVDVGAVLDGLCVAIAVMAGADSADGGKL